MIHYEPLSFEKTIAEYYQNQLMNLYDQLKQKWSLTEQGTRHMILQPDNA